jgi:TetR/AcrR family transcriptional regulator, copper-responsive repressor
MTVSPGAISIVGGVSVLCSIKSSAVKVFFYNMVHKKKYGLATADSAPRPRGRPRAYDADTALAQAMSAFWRFGYSATSLDQLSDATDMNRPSLYAAFGDKRALYLQTLDRYTERSKEGIAKALDPQLPLAEGLQRFYDSALAAYLPSGDPARGCYLIGTAVTEALGDEEVRTRLASALREFERMLEVRIRKAREDGEIEATADPQVLAMIASAVLYTLAIRSRAGESRAILRSVVATTIDLICARAPARKRRQRT